MAQTHLGDQPLKADAADRGGAGFAQIVVNHHDPVTRPAVGFGATHQAVW
jgi:hypothetical protein